MDEQTIMQSDPIAEHRSAGASERTPSRAPRPDPVGPTTEGGPADPPDDPSRGGPLDREAIWQQMNRMRRGATYRVIGALDVALWDLAGKAATLPLHKLIGSFRRRVPAYASSSTLANEAAYLEQLAGVKARGCSTPTGASSSTSCLVTAR